jgi:vacuolar iron transporter family protein
MTDDPRITTHHLVHRIGWLRAAVLGANDGIVSTASLIVGVAAANSARGDILIAGVAGLVAGAISMAAGEYVSVSSQADTEAADLEKERMLLRDDPDGELAELTAIYEGRGLDPALAGEVAVQLMSHNALEAHARDEIGISHTVATRPVEAALASAATFSVGAAVPLAAMAITPLAQAIPTVGALSLAALAALGAVSAITGGAPVLKAIVRVTLWGVFAMVATALIGRAFGTVVG